MLMHRLDWVHVEQEMLDFGGMLDRINSWIRLNGAPEEMLANELRRSEDNFRRYTIVKPDVEVEDNHEIVVGRPQAEGGLDARATPTATSACTMPSAAP